MLKENKMKLEFEAISENESFARMVIAAFVSELDPTIEEISDIKTAVSEAVTNCIIHAYENKGGTVYMEASIKDRTLHIIIKDDGIGIENIEQAKEPLYTSKPELERSGMGFTFMDAFMDNLSIESIPNSGTTIVMQKQIKN